MEDPFKISGEIISNNTIHPNDITFISSWKYPLLELEARFSARERSASSFCTLAYIKRLIDNYKGRIFSDFRDKSIEMTALIEKYLCRCSFPSAMLFFLNEASRICDGFWLPHLKMETEELMRTILSDYSKLDRIQKNSFQMNSGVLKFATIHSFKGMESPTIVAFLKENDPPALVYTAITRAKTNLIIFDAPSSKYRDFFIGQKPDNDCVKSGLSGQAPF